jgi:hypothetical protein
LNGTYNIASGNLSTVSNGYANCSSGTRSFVGNGEDSRAIGTYSFVGNGGDSVYSFGNPGNYACGTYSTIVNGRCNRATARHSNILGGESNCATSIYSSVVGGCGNQATGYGSIVGGGICNLASGTNSFVGGGQNNCAAACWSVIGGGVNNRTTNDTTANFGVIAGGSNNFLNWPSGNVISGGANNTVGGAGGGYATVAGGFCNVASGNGTLASGCQNTVTGCGSVVGGRLNTSSGEYNVIFGYAHNSSAGYSSIFGLENKSNAFNTTNIGRYSCAYLTGQFVQGGEWASPSAYGGSTQISTLVANRNSVSLTTGATTGVSLDGTGTTSLIVPLGTNRLWKVKVEWVGVVTGITGTATGVSAGDAVYGESNFGFKKISGVASLGPTLGDTQGSDTAIMDTSSLSYSAGGSGQLALTFTGPTFTGGGSVTMRVTAKIMLVELGY